jgi:hypothetical protein
VSNLLDQAIEAAGGLERWNSASEIFVDLDSGGRAFEMRWRRGALRNVTGTVTTAEPSTLYAPYPTAGQRGIFEPDRVRIETESGELVAERTDPRAAFSGRAGLRRNIWWDRLDLLYFAGYALWNYMAFPFMLTRPGFEVSEGEPLESDGQTWRRLEVRFPPGFPAHCPEQAYYLDSDGLLRRNDYTAEPFGNWARAIHLTDDHRDFDGLVVPTRRRVHPRLPNGKPLRAVTIVWIDVKSVVLR